MKIKRYKAFIECYKHRITRNKGRSIFPQLLVDYGFAPNTDYEYDSVAIGFGKDVKKDMVSKGIRDVFRIYYATYTLTRDLYNELFSDVPTRSNNYNDVANKFSEIIGEKVICVIQNSELLLPVDGYDLKYFCQRKSLKLRLLLADGAEFLKSEEAQTPALFNVQELHTFNCLAFDSIRKGLSELGLVINEAIQDDNDKISMQIINTDRLNLELRCVLNKYKDKILSEMFNGELKKFLDDSGLSLEYFWLSNTVNKLPSKIEFEKNKLKGENNETK